jgi:hypothetical protein
MGLADYQRIGNINQRCPLEKKRMCLQLFLLKMATFERGTVAKYRLSGMKGEDGKKEEMSKMRFRKDR